MHKDEIEGTRDAHGRNGKGKVLFLSTTPWRHISVVDV